MKRLAYVCADPGVPVFGTKGCSVHVQEVLRALLSLGTGIDLIAARRGGNVPADLAAVRIHDLPIASAGDPAAREQACRAANGELRRILDRIPGVDVVLERYSLWSHAGMEWAATEGIPGFLEVNAPLIAEQSDHRMLVDREGAEESARRAFEHASALLAVSAEVAGYLVDCTGAPERVHVLPNGVNPDRFRFPRPAGAAGVFTVGFVGTLKPWHGVERLVEAFAAAAAVEAEFRLLVVGDGPQRGGLEQRVDAFGIRDRVEFTGAVEPARIPDLLARMDVATAPYPGVGSFYFSPLKVYEYMAAGVPVVASRIGQLATMLEHGRTGLLVEPGDVDGLAGALLGLHRDAGLRRRLGAAGREHVCRHHTWRQVAGRILQLSESRRCLTAGVLA